MGKIVVLTGAGISAESGINTFRDADGLWEGHDVMEVATPQGWKTNPELVLEFYNARRRQLKMVKPNAAHLALKKLEDAFEVTIITQNVDDLHERAGSRRILHLHGELMKARSTFDPDLILDWKEDIKWGDMCEHNAQLRPHVVWFGEAVPMMEKAIEEVSEAEKLIIVGTSMQVYPAAGLIDYLSAGTPIYYIDPKPNLIRVANLEVIAEKASKGVPDLVEKLLNSTDFRT